MYSRQHLDSPPPASQFRRPWSPDPLDPMPSMRRSRNDQPAFDSYLSEENNHDFDFNYAQYPQPPSQLRQQRREPSDVSVDALDLADYARTLRPHPRDVIDSLHPPSLVSRGNTLSSSTNSHSSRSSRRPFSLPPQSSQSSRNAPPATLRTHNYPYLVNEEPEILSPPTTDSEIDISQFPAWSRNWYQSKIRAGAFNSPTSPPDLYTPLPPSHFDLKRPSAPYFDPDHTLKYGSNHSQLFDADPYSTSHSSYSHGNLPPLSLGHDSTRDLLPWSADPPEYGPTIDSSLKEERIRMLEREFGPNAKSNKGKDDFLDENGKPLVGTVDSKGNLVTQGPKKRIATRVLQIICAFAAAIPSIYAAVSIKPNPAAPPAGKPAAYVLYVVSVITLIALLSLFLFYPCCCRRRKKSGVGAGSNPFANGMMVLPVQGLPGGKKDKKNKGRKGKKNRGGMMGGGDVQVNLIVDPNVFGNNHEEEEEEEEEEEFDWERGSSIPGGWNGSSAGGPKKKRRRANKRRSVFAGLAMEEEWKKARQWTKKVMAFDIIGIILWGAVFVFILLGKRCPIGGYEGWCNAYNVSTAAACFLCVAFCISTFFGIKDLHTSKVSPRTRT